MRIFVELCYVALLALSHSRDICFSFVASLLLATSHVKCIVLVNKDSWGLGLKSPS